VRWLTVLIAVSMAIAAPSAQAKPLRQMGYGQIRYAGKGPEAWHWKYVQLRRSLVARPSTLEAIALASTAYRVSYSTLRRKAWCESRFDPWARNGSEASGLFQFLPSTWRTTPYAGFSVFDPFANALAAGWMHSVGRGGEWSCR
jgi:soluble lytic murein transglycosylase-like protein